MSDRTHLKDSLVDQFSYLKSDLGFRGPRITDRSLLLTLLYRSEAFNLEITAELRDWFLDFHLRPAGRQGDDHGSQNWITSYNLIKSHFTQSEKDLFEKAAKATTPRETWGSVSAMQEAAGHLAILLKSLLPRLLEESDGLFKIAGPGPA